MRILRVLALLALLLVAALSALRFVPLDQLRAPIDSAITSAIGRPVQIAGDINIEIDLDPHIEIDEVAVWELPGRAEFERFELEFQFLPLLRGVLEVSEIVLVGGRVAIDASGDPESRGGEETTKSDSRELGPVDLSHLDFVGVDLDIVHRNRAGLETRLHFDQLDVRSRQSDEPIEVGAAGRVDGLAFDLLAELGTPGDLAAGRPLAVDVSGVLADLELRAVGQFERPRELAGFEIEMTLDAPHLGALALLTDGALPEVGPIHIQALLSDADGVVGVEKAVVQIGDAEDPIELVAQGDLDDIAELDEIAFSVTLRARDLPVIGELLEVELPHVETVTLTGRFSGTDELLVSDSFSLGLNETTIEGDLSGTFVPGKRPLLKARLESSVVHLGDIGIEQSPTAPARERAEDDGFTLDSPLPFGELPPLDAQIQVRVHEIAGEARLMIDELAVDVILTEERVALENIEVTFAGGAVSGGMQVKPRVTPPAVSLDLEVNGAQIHRLLSQFEETPSMAGLVDASVHLVSSGRSVRDWISEADGGVTLLVREGRVRTKYATALEADLLKAAFRFRGPSEFSGIQCMLADFQLERGVAEIETLWFETDETTIRAEGAFDLRRQWFDVKLRPKPKKRGLVGYAAAVSVKGPFADPKIRPIPGSLAASAVKGFFSGLKRGAAPLLDPVSDPILNRFWKRRGGVKGPCAAFVEGDS
ncbi:MAG: AsmA family protein [Deltaproteobacteria bacterium]|nr:AsmA family protein [Deltaproteobacteria bacterium]